MRLKVAGFSSRSSPLPPRKGFSWERFTILRRRTTSSLSSHIPPSISHLRNPLIRNSPQRAVQIQRAPSPSQPSSSSPPQPAPTPRQYRPRSSQSSKSSLPPSSASTAAPNAVGGGTTASASASAPCSEAVCKAPHTSTLEAPLPIPTEDLLVQIRAPVRSRIPSDLPSLKTLSEAYPWLPSPDSVRPTPEHIRDKEETLAAIDHTYLHRSDYFIHTIFELPVTPVLAPAQANTRADSQNHEESTIPTHETRSEDERPKNSTEYVSKMTVTDETIQSYFASLPEPVRFVCKLLPNPYPYQVLSGTSHSVLWFLHHPDDTQALTDDDINSSIRSELKKLFSKEGREIDKNYEFAWYHNPKPTVRHPRLAHVQVFWCEKCTHKHSDPE